MYLRKLTLLLVCSLFVFAASSQICLVGVSTNSISLTPATCVGTVATLKGSVPTGGNGTYSYQWQRSTGNCILGNFIDIASATDIDYGVPAGTPPNVCFRRRVTSGTCPPSFSNQISVSNSEQTTPQAPQVTVTQPTCTLNTGTITVTSPAPSANVSYSIDGVTYSNTTGIFTGLSAGTYEVTVRYLGANCFSPARSVTLNSVLTPTGTISPAAQTICAGSPITLTISGTATSYQWLRNGTAIPGATSSTYTTTLAGTYTATISNGICSATTSNSSVITVSPLPSGSITPSASTICQGDTAVLTATGGSAYQWFRNNVPLGNQTSATYKAFESGTYTVDIISAQGCRGQSTNNAVVTVNPAPTGTISPANPIICAGGSVTLSLSGTSSSYQWFLNGNLIPNATNSTYTATLAGAYTVRLSNATCTALASNTVTAIANSAISVGTNINNADCVTPTGIVTVIAGGGSGSGYTYSKDNGANFQASNVFPGLAAGTYQIVVRDAAGCRSAPVAASVQTFASTLTATANTTPIPCSQNTGSVVINASGGTGPYVYSLNSGMTQTSNTFPGLTAGTYNVLVKDAVGCNFSVGFTIAPIVSTLNAAGTFTDARCGAPAGSATILAAGGNPPYRYNLDDRPVQTSNTFPVVGVGVHKITVQDASNCTYVVNFEIRRIGDVPNLLITNPPAVCPGTTANLQAPSITAGSDPGLLLTYWRDTNATQSLATPTAASPGKYFIRGTNAAGCVSIKSVVVSVYTGTRGSITASGPLVPCIGSANVLTASTGTAYQWYRNDVPITGATSATYSATVTGAYSVAINDGTCSVRAADTVTLTFRDCSGLPDRNIFVPTAFTPNKNGQNDVLRPILNSITTLNYFKIYNRWGQVVFETRVMGQGWDGTVKGTPQPSETYSWILECVGLNGQILKRSGRTLLIR